MALTPRQQARAARTPITAAQVVDATSYAYSGRKVTPAEHLAAVTRLLPVARSIIERYGGDGVPEAVASEGIIRLTGYFLEARFGAFASSQTKIPPQAHAAAFRNSGAQALISPWKVRRAGAV